MLDPDRSPSLPSGLTIARLIVFLGSRLGTTAKSLSAPTMWTCQKKKKMEKLGNNRIFDRPKSSQTLTPNPGNESRRSFFFFLHFQSLNDWNVDGLLYSL